MRALIILLISLFFSFGVNSQQRAVYSNFMMSDYYHNPAIAGTKDVHVANVSYRNQWVGFSGAPSLIMANFYGSLKNKKKVGYGASIISEKTGLTQNTAIYLNYAQHFKLSDNLKLGLGIKPGFMQYRIKLYDAILADEGDNVLTGNVYSANALDLSAGFNLYSDKFFIMASVQQLLGKGLRFTSYNENLNFHYNAIFGYNFLFKKKNIQIQPSLMMKYTSPVPIQYTGMVKTTFNEKYWFGLLYTGDMNFSTSQYPINAAGISLGMTFKERFMVGYSFDYTLSKISKYQSGSHEIMLTFVITKNKPTLEEEDDKLNNSIMEELKKKMEEKEQQKEN
tara:strand:- start:14565 stop:15575 length:1011 start_codon:yes stop_codon:yes gene_type:complete